MSESPGAATAAAIFEAALQLPLGRRAAYLDGACAADAPLRRRVEFLLGALEAAGTFMEEPAAAPRPASAPIFADETDPSHPGGERRLGPAAVPADAAVGQTLGRYTLLERIGEGGCGVVYLAEQSEPVRRRVALKVIKLGMDTRQVIARFEVERQALAMMDHPHIAKVLDGGTTADPRPASGHSLPSEGRGAGGESRPSIRAGRPYFVMELVRGIPITDYCDQARLTTRERLELFVKVCQAVQHAHQKGIIHRDLKPSNILVTVQDGVPGPKVIDFGIAKAIEGRLTDGTLQTQLHQFIGTPAYMSPEQAEPGGLDIDTRSDIYSLGVLLYELLAGCPPFAADRLMAAGIEAMRRVIREQEPARPSTRYGRMGAGDATTAAQRRSTDAAKLRQQLRGDLDWIVMKCLEKDRTRRYETANGLAFDLRRHLADEPVLARPPSAGYRFRKTFRRHRLIFGAATVVALALVGGIGVSTWQTFAARKAQRETEAARRSESEANELLRVQVGETEAARRSAEQAARAEGAARRQAEGALQLMQVQKAGELLGTRESALGVGYLLRVSRANPSHEVAAARLATAVLRPFGRELIEPLRHSNLVSAAQFSPDGSRVVTASWDNRVQVWDAGTGRPVGQPFRHGSRVISARFGPDGLRVVTAAAHGDGTARLWDARTGLAATEPMRHEAHVQSAEFSPDGSRVVTASFDNTARVWDALTGEPVTASLRHSNWVHSARFSPDGSRVVTASWDGMARVWDSRTGQPVTEPIGHEYIVYDAQFSPDGSRVVTASDGGGARVWNARTGQPASDPIRHEKAVWTAQFSPDGLWIATASDDRTARVWSVRTGRPVTGTLGHGARVWSAWFSPDGLRIVTASDDGTARVWDARSGEPVTEPLRHVRKVLAAQFSPDGLRVVTASEDQTARVWDTRHHRPVTASLRHGGGVWGARFSLDGAWVATASEDQTARVWDARTGRAVAEPLRHEGWVRDVDFSPDGSRVVTASDDRTARVWDARTGQPLTRPIRHQGRVICARFSPDGSRVVTASGDGDNTARVWDARTGEPVTDPLPHGWNMPSVQFSPDGSRVATAFVSQAARVWDARTGQPVTEPIPHDGFVGFLEFSPDGARLVTASEDQTARVWDARTGQPVSKALRHEGPVRSARFSPDGSRVVTASDDQTARVWDARTGEPLTEPLRHRGPVSSAQFGPDGSRVVTASKDHTARVWDARSGQPVGDPLGHDGEVRSARFSPDGGWVVTASLDGTARLWDVEAPTLPVPDWFLDWAEARVGRRFASGDGTEAIPWAERQRQREQVQARTDTGFYTRLARWVEADPTTRTLSPNAVVTVPEHVRRLIDADTVASLREALALSPGESEAWGRLALHLATGEGHQDREDRLTEAEWDARHALELDPRQPEARRALETVRSLRP